jgi:SAM-dependent methyltransferase
MVLGDNVSVGDDVASDFGVDLPYPTRGEVKGFPDRGDGVRCFRSEVAHEANRDRANLWTGITWGSGFQKAPPLGGDDVDQTLSAYYRRRASEYDEVYEKPERQGDIARLSRIIREFADSRHVLEVAAGTGFWTLRAAETASAICATDLADEPLAIARDRPYSGAATFALCDAFALDTIQGSFDAGLACFWLSHLSRSDMERFAAHLASRLEPGSPVLFADNRYVDGSSSPIIRTDAHGNTYQRRALHDGETFEVLKNFPNATELSALGEAVGTEVTVTELTYYWAITFRTSE